MLETVIGTHYNVSYLEKKNADNLQEKPSCSGVGGIEMYVSCYNFSLFTVLLICFKTLNKDLLLLLLLLAKCKDLLVQTL